MIKTIFWVSVIFIIYAYLLYPLVLFLFMRRKHVPKQLSEHVPEVSPLVSAYNEEKIISDKIENLLNIDYPKEKVEIVIASDGSDDDTDNIVSRYVSLGIRHTRVAKRNGKVNVLNTVIPELNGEIIVFSDANTMFKGDTVKKLVRKFADPSIGCVCGALTFQNDDENEVGALEGFYWRYEQFMKRVEGARGSLLGANGGVYAIRKHLFEPLPSDTIVEDFVLPMKILAKGYKVVYEPEAIAYEETAKKIVQEMGRRIRIGAGDFQALLLTWKLLNPLRGFTAFAFFSHKVMRWFVPFLLISAFASNIFLLDQKFYFATFLTQCAFYGAALMGRILSRINLNFKMFGLPYYFISMNIALFLGFIRFCTGTQSVAWKRTER